MRGEDSSHAFSASESPGSPPHARGRRTLSIPSPRRPGITPACAGKTAVQTGSKSRSKDHPRMRGEDVRDPHKLGECEGSPPHARGRPVWGRWFRGRGGITPACAGKTPYVDSDSSTRSDHPHMRGEDKPLDLMRWLVRGSPPHARGRRGLSHSIRQPGGSPPHARGRRQMDR